jgi:ABC-type sugar transport system ATPase subunit
MSTMALLKITYYGSIFNVAVNEKDAIMSVKCLLVETQESHQVIIFKINDKIAKLVISGETKIKSGDTFFINFKQEKILFFDYKSHEEI